MKNRNFILTRVSGQPVEDSELIDDLKRVVNNLKTNTLPQKQYGELGQYDISTVIRRFGTWNKALQKANIKISNRVNIGDEELYKNILRLWEHFGRQPRRRDLSDLPSTISQYPYNRRFSSWTNALEAFVEYANGRDIEEVAASPETGIPEKRKTGREPSIRLRWKVLQRDNFKCCACGASPAITTGIELHVDHKIPWSKGGNTILENLQTLCLKCNNGKSNEI